MKKDTWDVQFVQDYDEWKKGDIVTLDYNFAFDLFRKNIVVIARKPESPTPEESQRITQPQNSTKGLVPIPKVRTFKQPPEVMHAIERIWLARIIKRELVEQMLINFKKQSITISDKELEKLLQTTRRTLRKYRAHLRSGYEPRFIALFDQNTLEKGDLLAGSSTAYVFDGVLGVHVQPVPPVQEQSEPITIDNSKPAEPTPITRRPLSFAERLRMNRMRRMHNNET